MFGNPIVTQDYLEEMVNEVSENTLNLDNPNIRELTGDNKLSNVFVIDEKYLIKIVTRRHVEYHRLLTLFWNTSLYYAQSDNFFVSFDDAYDMVQHEYEISKKINDLDIPSPKPIEYIDYNKCGMIILEYIPNTKQFGDLNKDDSNIDAITHELFECILTLHEANIPHGDLQQDNILISNDNQIYIIDANNIDNNNIEYQYYDIASIISTVSIVLEPKKTIKIAQNYFDKKDIKKSKNFIDVINLQFGHNADSAKIKAEIDSL